MVKVVPFDEDVMGFCNECIRMRWLRLVTEVVKTKNGELPKGVCRQCAREKGDELFLKVYGL